MPPSSNNAQATQSQQAVNIWAQMSYTPPRGPCSQKVTIMSSCACYRFMCHPLKAATSFDCDGCGHHASFHQMENPTDEDAIRRWNALEAAQADDRHLNHLGLVDRRLVRNQPKRRQIANGRAADRDPVVEEVITGMKRKISDVVEL